jgi:hypothetical protein
VADTLSRVEPVTSHAACAEKAKLHPFNTARVNCGLEASLASDKAQEVILPESSSRPATLS